MNKNQIAKNLKYLRTKNGIEQSQIARLLGKKSTSAISEWESGVRTPNTGDIHDLATYYGVTIDEIINSDLSDDLILEKVDYYEYDYISEPVAAGSLERIDACYEFDKITLPDRLMGRYARRKSILATRINGQSMNRLIPDESFIFIDRNFNTLHQIKDGDVVVFHDGGEYSCKRIFIDNHNNRFIFRPDSDDVAFTDIIIDFENTENLKLIGKVVMYLTELD